MTIEKQRPGFLLINERVPAVNIGDSENHYAPGFSALL